MAKVPTKSSGITVIDVDLESDRPWSDALKPISGNGEKLLKAFNDQGRGVIGAAGWWALQRGVGVLHGVLGGEHGAEIDDIADALGASTSEVVLANAAYDISNIGCSTIAAATADGPLHARNLDWPSFRGGILKRSLLVARMRNAPNGDYALVTWPGMFGALTGIAPGRFSITVNFVTHDEDSTGAGLVKRAVGGYWPVAWAVRRAFDEAEDFEEAVTLLKDTYLLAPVLLTVVGTKNKERAVIECSCDDYEIRTPKGRQPLIVTNHYQDDDMAEHNTDLSELNTEDRATLLEEMLEGEDVTVKSAFAALSDEDIMDGPDTQHQVVMQPSTGKLVVRIPGSRAVEVQL